MLILKKHRWIAAFLSLICTGLGMFYIGTAGMIAGGTVLMVMQGTLLFLFFMTLGFLGLVLAPLALGLHIVGFIITMVYFNKRAVQNPHLAQKKQRRFASPGKIIVRTAMGAAIFIGSLYVGYSWGTEPFTKSIAEKRAVKEAAESYLEEKYNEPFKVTNVKYTWAVGTYTIEAHPKQNPDLVFTLESDSGNPSVISNDNYLNELWAVQLKEILTPLVDELYPDTAVFRVWVNAGHNETPVKNYSDLINEVAASVGMQHVSLTVFADLKADDLSMEQERVMELIQRMPEVMAEGETGLEVNYYPSELNTPGNVKLANEGSFNEDFNINKKTYMFRTDNISQITSPNDIEIRELGKD